MNKLIDVVLDNHKKHKNKEFFSYYKTDNYEVSNEGERYLFNVLETSDGKTSSITVAFVDTNQEGNINEFSFGADVLETKTKLEKWFMYSKRQKLNMAEESLHLIIDFSKKIPQSEILSIKLEYSTKHNFPRAIFDFEYGTPGEENFICSGQIDISYHGVMVILLSDSECEFIYSVSEQILLPQGLSEYFGKALEIIKNQPGF